MKKIDCLIIGHNEIGVARYNQLFRLAYGKDSKNYRESAKYNLSSIKCDNKYYSPMQILNLITKGNDNINIVETFSLTIAYLGSFLHRVGFSFDYINSYNTEKEKLIYLLEHEDIKSIAITTTYYLSPIPIIEIVSLIRKYNKTAKIIVGGPFITNQVRRMQPVELQDLFFKIKADFFVYSNEGEYTLAKLVGSILNNCTVENINNVYYYNSKAYVFTSYQPEDNDLDDNSIDWMLFKDDIKDIVNMRTSKSCPFSCAFCSFPGHSGKYKVMSLSKIENELNTLKKINKHVGISFIDDTFNVPHNRFNNLLKLMIKNKYEFKWYSFLKAQNTDREMIKLMKEAGCIQVFCGIESGNQNILDNIDKKSKVKKNLEAFELLHNNNLTSIASFIVGFPGETLETYNDTLSFLEKAQPTFYRSRLWWYDQTAPIHNKREIYYLSGSDYIWKHKTMDSNEAQVLANQMCFSVNSSIHVTDYPVPFEMLIKGFDQNEIKNYLRLFSNYIKDAAYSPEMNYITESVFHEVRQTLNLS